jgi:hypothetical protein
MCVCVLCVCVCVCLHVRVCEHVRAEVSCPTASGVNSCLEACAGYACRFRV